MEQLLKNWKLRMVKYRQEADNANSPITKVKAMNKFFILRDCIKELEEEMHYTRCCVMFYCVAKEHYPELVGDGLCKKQCKKCKKLEQ